MADASTIIGETILVNGNLTGDEDLLVLGRVEGSVTLTKTLHVHESGIVKANVQVKNAVISGIVVGNISASDSVEITEQGRMIGDIKAPRIIIVEGASFRGHVDMGDLEAQRPTGPLPARAEVKRTSSASSRPALPAASFARPTTGAKPAAAPVGKPATAPAKPAAAPVGAARPAGSAAAPPRPPAAVMAAAKKKVVVKKKG